MKKAKKFFKMIAFVSVLVFFAGLPSLLSRGKRRKKARTGHQQLDASQNGRSK